MKSFRIYILLILLIGISQSCTKDFDSINQNPNDPETVPNTNLLVRGIYAGVDRIYGASMNMTYAGLWAQHYAKIQYIDEDYYDYRPDALDGHFQGVYTGSLADLQFIINSAADGNMKGAAMIMKAYYMSVLTDMWGDVPYTQALNVNDYPFPVYDSQADIYADLIASLNAATSMMRADGDALGAGDILFNGNIDGWKKFGNSLVLRLANRAAHKGAAFAAAAAAAAGSDLITTNAENAAMYYPDATTNPNPIYNNKYLDGRNDHAVSSTLVALMQGDPRLPVYAEPIATGEFVGQPNGSTQPANLSDISAIGAYFRDDFTSPSVLMTAAEVHFNLAELNGDKQAYLDGVAASCAQYGVTMDANFTAAIEAAYDANPAEAIATQKWIALFGNGCEAFTEYRRTGYPASIAEVPGSVWPDLGVPKRFPYAFSETGTNKVNVESAIAAQKIDASGLFGDKMWWAK